MKKQILTLFFLSVFINAMTQESSFGQYLEGEINFFYFKELDNNKNEFYNELSISSAFNISLNNYFYLGIRSYVVRGRSPISPTFTGWHTLIGPTVKYNIIQKKRIEFNTEAGYFYGNYCPNCTPDNEYYNTFMHYISLLLEIDFQVFKAIPQLWFKVSFASNNPLNKKDLHGYNLPLIGVQYKFGKVKNSD